MPKLREPNLQQAFDRPTLHPSGAPRIAERTRNPSYDALRVRGWREEPCAKEATLRTKLGLTPLSGFKSGSLDAEYPKGESAADATAQRTSAVLARRCEWFESRLSQAFTTETP
jgi:hypothetical protein